VSWGEVGQLVGGIALLTTAFVAAATFILVTLWQANRQWAEDFRALIADFWKDEDASLVRMWVISDQLYSKELKSVLIRRNAQKENALDHNDSAKLDKIDKFLSTLVRFQTFKARWMFKQQRNLLAKMPYDYWLVKALSHPELRRYIEEHWGKEIEIPPHLNIPLPASPLCSSPVVIYTNIAFASQLLAVTALAATTVALVLLHSKSRK